MPERLEAWRALLSRASRRSSLSDGVRLEFSPEVPIMEIASLAAAELECCSFFTFAITLDGTGTVLDVRGPEEAQDLVTALFEAG